MHAVKGPRMVLLTQGCVARGYPALGFPVLHSRLEKDSKGRRDLDTDETLSFVLQDFIYHLSEPHNHPLQEIIPLVPIVTEVQRL